MLIAEKKKDTKKTYCNPKKPMGNKECGLLASHGTSQTLSSFDGLKIQMSHDRFFGGQTGSVCSETIRRSTNPQRDYLYFPRAKIQKGKLPNREYQVDD